MTDQILSMPNVEKWQVWDILSSPGTWTRVIDIDAFKEIKAERDRYRDMLKAVQSQMCWEADRDQLTVGMRDLHDSVTRVLATPIRGGE